MAPSSDSRRSSIDRSMLAAVAAAIEPVSDERLSGWVLVAGTLDHHIRTLFARARVIMWDATSTLRLPRESFHLALWLADASLPSADLDTLVTVRNALGRDAALFAAGGTERLDRIRELAQTAGLSRCALRSSTSTHSVIELRR